MAKSYLGDGVYVDVERDMLKLTTEDGIEKTNTVYLEPEVWAALERYVARLGVLPKPACPQPDSELPAGITQTEAFLLRERANWTIECTSSPSVYLRTGSHEFRVHVKTYPEAVEVMRHFKRKTWEKHPYDDGSYITSTENDVEICVFFEGLPPSCRKVTTMRKVPRTEIKETGEFIEVPETKIVCDGGHEKEA